MKRRTTRDGSRSRPDRSCRGDPRVHRGARAGALLAATIDTLGPREEIDEDAVEALIDERLDALGDAEVCRIEIAPFAVERFGVQFGLVVREPEDDDEVWAVDAMPGLYMAFFEPWDSGAYDT